MCVATALTACGIETLNNFIFFPFDTVATALTACGIETLRRLGSLLTVRNKLQQYLPFTVLKPFITKAKQTAV